MKFSTFIVVDDTMTRNKETFTFTVSGDVIYPLETAIPVIKKGSGCIGIAIIKFSTRSATSTTITFKMSKCSTEDSRAYYNLYRNQISLSSDTEDSYENASDMIIPGMMTSASIKPTIESNSKHNTRSSRRNNSSLSDMLYDDDEDFPHWE